jgi:hypothetical protein
VQYASSNKATNGNTDLDAVDRTIINTVSKITFFCKYSIHLQGSNMKDATIQSIVTYDIWNGAQKTKELEALTLPLC